LGELARLQERVRRKLLAIEESARKSNEFLNLALQERTKRRSSLGDIERITKEFEALTRGKASGGIRP
jgi:hypothetical protein